MHASLLKSLLSLTLAAGACAGCALPRRKDGKISQGPPISQLQPSYSGSSSTAAVVPIANANAGTNHNQLIQQVAAYAPANSGAEAVVRRVPDEALDFNPYGLPMVPASVDANAPIVVTAPEAVVNDAGFQTNESPEQTAQRLTDAANMTAHAVNNVPTSISMNTAPNAVGLGHGHAAARQLQPPSLAERVNTEMLAGNYLIELGDSLDIKFRNTTELDEVVTVRPDGMISLPIIGDVQAAGVTPEGLRQLLMARYSNELRKPDITVIVRSFAGNNVYIGGEVFSPGRIPLNGRVTTLNAIILAGGFKDTADQKRVIVRRADGSCCEYDLKSVLECKGGRDIQLQPYDVVYVPKSHIAKVNQFVDQYIEKVLPFSRSFGIFVSHNTGLTSAVGSP